MAIRFAGGHGRWEWVQASVPFPPCPLQIFEKGLEPPLCYGEWHLLVHRHQGVSVSFIATRST